MTTEGTPESLVVNQGSPIRNMGAICRGSRWVYHNPLKVPGEVKLDQKGIGK